MNQTTRSILFGALSFVVAGAVAYAAGRIIGGEDVPPAGLPTFEAPEALIVPIPVEDGDFDAFAEAYLEDLQAAREAASSVGVGFTPGAGFQSEAIAGSGVGGNGAAESGTDPDPGAEPSGPTGLPSEASPADDRATDLCADGGDECPEGVGGTVLLAIRNVPLVGSAQVDPPVPGAGFDYSSPVCPAGTGEDGRTVLGVSTSRPVVLEMTYKAGAWDGSAFEVEGEFEVTTSEAADARWTEWLLDDGIPNTDPRAWVQHCVTLPDLPPRSDYRGSITLVDKYDPSITYRIPGFRFAVRNEGLVPGAQRRPTFLLGFGIDDLRVGLTSTPEQEVVVVAVADASQGVCDTGGADRSVIDRPDAIRGRVISDNPIPDSVIGDPGYPYFVDHTRSLVFSVGLQEGTDYMVCVYWFGAGPAFDATVVDIAEEVAVSTPEAYRPRLTLRDIANTFGTVSGFEIGVRGCPLFESNDMATSRTGAWDWTGEPQALCTLETELTRVDRGIGLRTGVTLGDGVEAENFPSMRTPNLRCDPSGCRPRLSDLAVVPLPRIATERRLCGTGFGSVCGEDVEIPMRSVGDAVIEIAYVDVPGNGLTDWSIDEASEFAITPPVLAEIPQLDLTATYEVNSVPWRGARANITVVADRPVSLRVTVDGVAPDGDPACRITAPVESLAFDQPALLDTHSFTLEPLCLGSDYRLLVTAQDAGGTEGVVVGRVVGPSVDVSVPPVVGFFELTATISAPNDSDRYLIELRPISVIPRTAPSWFGQTFPLSMSPSARIDAQRAGWFMLSNSSPIVACAVDLDARPLVVVAGAGGPGSSAFLGQEQNLIRVQAEIWRVRGERSGVGVGAGGCLREELVESVQIQATVTLADLRNGEGITLTSDSGSTTVTMWLARWRLGLGG